MKRVRRATTPVLSNTTVKASAKTWLLIARLPSVVNINILNGSSCLRSERCVLYVSVSCEQIAAATSRYCCCTSYQQINVCQEEMTHAVDLELARDTLEVLLS